MLDFDSMINIGARHDGRRVPKDFCVYPDGGIRKVPIGAGGPLRAPARVHDHLAQQVNTPSGRQALFMSLREAYDMDERDDVRADGYENYVQWWNAGSKAPKGLRKPGASSSFPEYWLPQIVVKRRAWADENRQDAGYTPPEAPTQVEDRKTNKRAKQPAKGDLERIADVD